MCGDDHKKWIVLLYNVRKKAYDCQPSPVCSRVWAEILAGLIQKCLKTLLLESSDSSNSVSRCFPADQPCEAP